MPVTTPVYSTAADQDKDQEKQGGPGSSFIIFVVVFTGISSFYTKASSYQDHIDES